MSAGIDPGRPAGRTSASRCPRPEATDRAVVDRLVDDVALESGPLHRGLLSRAPAGGHPAGHGSGPIGPRSGRTARVTTGGSAYIGPRAALLGPDGPPGRHEGRSDALHPERASGQRPGRRLGCSASSGDCGLRSMKDGCAPEGSCGACTVIVDGRAVVSCAQPASRVDGRSVLTLEGLPATSRRRLGPARSAHPAPRNADSARPGSS